MYPPYPFLVQISDHCPKAMSTFLTLWREKPLQGKLSYDKDDVNSIMLISWTRFKNDLRALAREGVLSIEEYPKRIEITLEEAPDIDAKDFTLC